MPDYKQLLFKIAFILSWVLIALSIGAFWISLRTRYYSLEYSLIALGLWVSAFGLNYWLKKKKGNNPFNFKKRSNHL